MAAVALLHGEQANKLSPLRRAVSLVVWSRVLRIRGGRRPRLVVVMDRWWDFLGLIDVGEDFLVVV
jgi:hypothetical protein